MWLGGAEIDAVRALAARALHAVKRPPPDSIADG
jgi:hypothetical protein